MVEQVEERLACAFTGHRPSRLGAVAQGGQKQRLLERIGQEVNRLYYEEGIRHYYTGMALGADLWFAQKVLELRRAKRDVKLHCVLPCYDQELSWEEEDREVYRSILAQADEAFYLNGAYFRGCMQERNRYLVERAATLLAVYDGEQGGGTAYTVRHARRLRRRIVVIDPREEAAQQQLSAKGAPSPGSAR
ncbi:MAG: DUF1273 family protein [Clostridia bacterium]|nr:DUF1273 family protein [Clostridia bacterium]